MALPDAASLTLTPPPRAGWFSRLLGRAPDPAEALRPLWHAVVARARAPEWYAAHGIADTVAGRFDAVTLVLALVMLRMEAEDSLRGSCAYLAELFVTDMDGQLRQSGVGDLVVGKRLGKLMSVLGGRIGAYREGLAGDDNALGAALARNITLVPGADAHHLAPAVRALAGELAALDAQSLLSARDLIP